MAQFNMPGVGKPKTLNTVNMWETLEEIKGNIGGDNGKSINQRFQDVNTSLAEKIPYKAVEEFGAKGDGTTDDSTAISNALNSNYNILFGQKTYYIGSQITVTNGKKIIQGNGAIIQYKGSESSSISNGGIIAFSNVNNVTIYDLTVNVNSTWITRPYAWDTTNYNNYLTTRSNTRDGISFVGCTAIKLNRMISTKGRTGFYVENCFKVSLTDCRSEYTWADGVFITGSSHNVSVEGHHCDNVGDDCYSADGYDKTTPDNNPHYVVFSNCTAIDSYGALTCLQGSHDTKVIGCTGYNHKFLPLKLGRLKLSNGDVVSGYNQYVIGCHVLCNDTIEADSNGGQPSKRGSIINGDSATYQSANHDIFIIDSLIQKSDTVYFELFFQYCTNVSLINTMITGFNIQTGYVTGIRIQGCQLYMQGAIVPSNTSYLSIQHNHLLNKGVNTSRGVENITLSDSNNVKILNNTYVNNNSGANEVWINATQAQDSITVDASKVGCTSAYVTNLGCNGVFNNVNNIAVARFKDGQLIYSPSTHVLSINKNGALTTIV